MSIQEVLRAWLRVEEEHGEESTEIVLSDRMAAALDREASREFGGVALLLNTFEGRSIRRRSADLERRTKELLRYFAGAGQHDHAPSEPCRNPNCEARAMLAEWEARR